MTGSPLLVVGIRQLADFRFTSAQRIAATFERRAPVYRHTRKKFRRVVFGSAWTAAKNRGSSSGCKKRSLDCSRNFLMPRAGFSPSNPTSTARLNMARTSASKRLAA